MDFHLDSPLKPNQQHAAIMLASGATIVAAAKKLRLNKRTIYYWLTDDEFKRYVNKLRAMAFDESMGVLVSIATKAALKLGELLDSPNELVVLRAARMIFDVAFEHLDHAELDERLSVIESRYECERRLGTGGGNADIPDEFADVFPVIKSNDDDYRMEGRIRERSRSGDRSRRNGHANGH